MKKLGPCLALFVSFWGLNTGAAETFDCENWVRSVCPSSEESARRSSVQDKRNAYLGDAAFAVVLEKMAAMRKADNPGGRAIDAYFTAREKFDKELAELNAKSGKTGPSSEALSALYSRKPTFLKAAAADPDIFLDSYVRYLVTMETNVDAEATISFEHAQLLKRKAVSDVRKLGEKLPANLKRIWESKLQNIELGRPSEILRYLRASAASPEQLRVDMKAYEKNSSAVARAFGVAGGKRLIEFNPMSLNSGQDRRGLEIFVENVLAHEVGHYVDPSGAPELYLSPSPLKTYLDCVVRSASRAKSGPRPWDFWVGQLMAESVAAQRLALSMQKLPELADRRKLLRDALESLCDPYVDSGMSTHEYLQLVHRASAELREAVGCPVNQGEIACRWGKN